MSDTYATSNCQHCGRVIWSTPWMTGAGNQVLWGDPAPRWYHKHSGLVWCKGWAVKDNTKATPIDLTD